MPGDGAVCRERSRGGAITWDGLECQGDTLQACAGGRTTLLDCGVAAPGFGCQSVGGFAFCGLASECLPAHLPGADQAGSPTICEGSTVVFCNAGRIERIDCLTLGFDGCAETAAGCVAAGEL